MYSVLETRPSKCLFPCFSTLLRQRKEMEHEHLAIKKYIAIPLLNPSCYVTKKKKRKKSHVQLNN